MVILFFFYVGCNSKMDNSGIGKQNVTGDNSTTWMRSFSGKGSLNHTFTNVVPLSDWTGTFSRRR